MSTLNLPKMFYLAQSVLPDNPLLKVAISPQKVGIKGSPQNYKIQPS